MFTKSLKQGCTVRAEYVIWPNFYYGGDKIFPDSFDIKSPQRRIALPYFVTCSPKSNYFFPTHLPVCPIDVKTNHPEKCVAIFFIPFFAGNGISDIEWLFRGWYTKPYSYHNKTRCQIWCTIEFHRDPISKVLSEW